MSLPRINFLHLTVSEIQPGQTISRRPPTRPSGRPPAHPDTMGENNTPTALQGCGVINSIWVEPTCKSNLGKRRTCFEVPVHQQTLIFFKSISESKPQLEPNHVDIGSICRMYCNMYIMPHSYVTHLPQCPAPIQGCLWNESTTCHPVNHQSGRD